MTAPAYQQALAYEHVPCPECGIAFGVPHEFLEGRRRDGRKFYCPCGHPMSYQQTEADRLKKQLEAEQRRREAAEAQRDHARSVRQFAENTARALRGHLTRHKRRVAAGVCPCCHRSFQALARHMKAQHPEFGGAE